MRQRVHFIILCLSGFLVYFHCFDFGIIELDDAKHIFENPHMRFPSWKGLWEYWTKPFFGFYIPVTYSFWMFLAKISLMSSGRLEPMVFHLANVLLHIANAMLVYRVLQQCFATKKIGYRGEPLLGALFFICHPLTVESVVWISSLRDLLSVFFLLFAMSQYIEFQSTKKFKHYGYATFFFLASLLSKPASSILPLLLMLLHIYFIVEVKGSKKWLIPWFFVSLFIVGMTSAIQSGVIIKSDSPYTLRPWLMVDSFHFYLEKIVFPFSLSLDYGRTPDWVFNNTHWIVSTFMILFLFLFRRLWFFLLFLFISVLPTSGLFSYNFQTFSNVSDRYVYLGLVAGSFFVATHRSKSLWMRRLVIGIFIGLGVCSSVRVVDWRTSISIFKATLKTNGRSELANNNIGFSYFRSGDFQSAIHYFEKAIELNPTAPYLHLNLGASLTKSGRRYEGLRAFFRSLELDPKLFLAHCNIARAYLNLGDLKRAKIHMKHARELDAEGFSRFFHSVG